MVRSRVRAAGLDPGEIRALTIIGNVTSRIVTEEGEKETNPVLTALMPIAFMLLLFVSVLSGGQYLMTTTIEDKSSRVIEVLLSAVSPMQLMTGKIIGQMAVGLVILAGWIPPNDLTQARYAPSRNLVEFLASPITALT